MKMIVGLGNPGKEYQKTRHNIGFLVLDEILQKNFDPTANWHFEKKFEAEICEVFFHDQKILFIKPQTYMNESGTSVQKILHFYKTTPEDLIVVHDEKDIPLGEIKIQKDRGSAGHNGIKSLIEHLGTQNFTRIRVGIRSENENKMRDVPKFVLGKFGIFEKSKMKIGIENAKSALLQLL